MGKRFGMGRALGGGVCDLTGVVMVAFEEVRNLLTKGGVLVFLLAGLFAGFVALCGGHWW